MSLSKGVYSKDDCGKLKSKDSNHVVNKNIASTLVIKNSHTYCENLQVIKTMHYAHAPRGIDW